MKFEKIILANIEDCYSALGIILNEEPFLFFAGEGNGSLHVFHGPEFKKHEIIWTGGGGTMSIVPIKEKEGWVLASRGFYSMVHAGKSTIEIIKYTNKEFIHKKIADLPYLHRFTSLRGPDGTTYILASTLSDFKANEGDWTRPGHVYYAELPEDLDSDFYLEMVQLEGDYRKNHGLYKTQNCGYEEVYIGSQEGIHLVTPPYKKGFAWNVSEILKQPTSDLALIDFDGDGNKEIAIITPFHGDNYKIFKSFDGDYREIYSYTAQNDFYHVVEGANINGEPVFIGGARKFASNLFLLTWDDKKKIVEAQQIDKRIGPSNVSLLNMPSSNIILCAARETMQAIIYVCIN